MISLLKDLGLTSCGLFCLGLSHTAIAQPDTLAWAAAPSDQRHGGQAAAETQIHDMEGGQSMGGKTIKGEVLRCAESDCVIKGQDGKEVLLHIDLAVLQAKHSIAPGEHIEAMVNEENQVLSILHDPVVMDRRDEK